MWMMASEESSKDISFISDVTITQESVRRTALVLPHTNLWVTGDGKFNAHMIGKRDLGTRYYALHRK
jgi:hypothetical protein